LPKRGNKKRVLPEGRGSMNFNLLGEHESAGYLHIKWIRLLLFVIIILTMGGAILSYVFFENDFLIRKWNIPLDPPGFYDSLQFAWASESHARGYDPLIENPLNPRGHQLNYPRIWHLLFYLGINRSHVNIMGSIVVILFFIGIGLFWFSKDYGFLTYLFLSMAAISPPVMLGIERSNIELVLFFVLSIALLLNYYSRIPALLLFIFASILKIYPVFGFLYLLKESKRRFLFLFFSAMGIFILYMVLTLDDFIQIYKTTPKLVGSSFGINVWWMGLRHHRLFALPISEGLAFLLNVLSHILGISIVVVTLFLAMRQKDKGLYRESPYIDAFRVGAGIYIGCFLLMNTHDYRLIFLIFTIPQIVSWMRLSVRDVTASGVKERMSSYTSLVTLLAMMLSLWSFLIMRFMGQRLTFVIEEFSNWVVLAGLLYLFFVSLPEWFMDYLQPSAYLKKRAS